MNRREALERVAILMGSTLSAPMIAGVMGQVTIKGKSVTVSAEQENLLAEIADIIIPTTDTPGAKAASVEKFIVRIMRDCYKKEDQEVFYKGLAKFEADSKTKFGKGFVGLDIAQKNEMVKLSITENKDFFQKMKELTTTGYFSSEIGATKALEYLPIPGKYEGCIPLKKGQKAWAL
jgi:Gluconate 2-dehydrogenase subunit 3